MINFKKTFIYFIISIFITSCNGQVKKQSSVEDTSKALALPVGHPKLKKFKGATQYDNIDCSLKDKNGNLWFGTSGGGVYRYDGKEFIQFTTQEGLSHNDVLTIYEDTDGILWFGTADGISTWNGKSFATISITTIRGSNAIPYQPTKTESSGWVNLDNAIDEIIQDKKGHYWFGGGKGIYRYDGKTFTNFTINDGIPNNTGVQINWVEKILADNNGNIWFGGRTTNGLLFYDGKTVTNIKPNGDNLLFKPSGDNWLWPILKDKKGNLWFSNWYHVYRFDGKSFTPFELKDSLGVYSTTCAFEDRTSKIWFGSDKQRIGNRLFVYNGSSFEHIIVNQSIPGDFIGSITEDNAGNLWIGKNNVELYGYNGKTFTLFSE